MSAAETVAHIVVVDDETETRGKTRRTRRCVEDIELRPHATGFVNAERAVDEMFGW